MGHVHLIPYTNIPFNVYNGFFAQGCELVILACNTASAKALRTIQQNDLPAMGQNKRVLGVIRPTTEVIGQYSKSHAVGILGTTGTVLSNSYPIEIAKFFPDIQVYQEACPMWVPLVENNEYNKPGADYFIEKHLQHLYTQSDKIDTLLLACTHYPLLINKIKAFAPAGTIILSQGEIVANSLKNYLERHPALAGECTQYGERRFYTTDSVTDFDNHASIFFGEAVHSIHVELSN